MRYVVAILGNGHTGGRGRRPLHYCALDRVSFCLHRVCYLRLTRVASWQARELVDLATIGDQEISNDQVLYVVKRSGKIIIIIVVVYLLSLSPLAGRMT